MEWLDCVFVTKWAPLSVDRGPDVAAVAKFTAKTFFGDENKTSYAEEYVMSSDI